MSANNETNNAQYAEIVRQAQSDKGYSLTDIGKPIPEEEDPNCLFKGRYLEKGGALVLTSVSGSGKSVITLQLAFSWAIGKSIFGITPMRPLKIAIFQTEDSAQDVAQFGHDIAEGYRCQGWTDEEVDRAIANIRFFDVDGKMDDEFLTYLKTVQARDKFDLVIINPLTGITCIDISNNADMNVLLCKKIDGVIKLNEETKCGLMIVHHTNKPPPANQRTKASQDRYALYLGAGAAKLANWMRAMLVIMPGSVDKPGQYEFIAAKRGDRLKWPAMPGKPMANPTRMLRHATQDEGIMFWYEVDTSDLAAATAGGKKTTTPPEPSDVTKDAERLARELKQSARTLTGARDLARKLFPSSKRGDAAYDELSEKHDEYGIILKPTGKSSQTIMGSEESVEKYFSELEEKAAKELKEKMKKRKKGKAKK